MGKGGEEWKGTAHVLSHVSLLLDSRRDAMCQKFRRAMTFEHDEEAHGRVSHK